MENEADGIVDWLMVMEDIPRAFTGIIMTVPAEPERIVSQNPVDRTTNSWSSAMNSGLVILTGKFFGPEAGLHFGQSLRF